MESALPHTPVLQDRCLELLAPAISDTDAVVVDATLGAGGHTIALLTAFKHLTVIGIDRDKAALALAQERIRQQSESAIARFIPFHGAYDEIPEVLEQKAQRKTAAGILFDLGVSSMQLDDPRRGFSYAKAAPLDMRMDPSDSQQPTAERILATAPQPELVRILRQYGEERFAPHIARAIVQQREHTAITSSEQLVDLIRDTIPAAARRSGGNPAKRTFQALRIAVNNELEILQRAIPRAISALQQGGRLLVMSYQSLEDRIVKQAFAAGSAVNAPPDMPIVPDEQQPYLKLLTRGAQRATDEEIAKNPRAKPVRLRGVELIRPIPPSRLRGAK